MTVVIHGSRQTIANRYEAHAQAKVGQGLVQRTLDGDYTPFWEKNGFCCHMAQPMHHGMPGGMGMMGMPGAEMYGGGGYGMYGGGMYADSGVQLPGWLMSGFLGATVGAGIYKLVKFFTGKKHAKAAATQNQQLQNVQQQQQQQQIDKTQNQKPLTRATGDESTRLKSEMEKVFGTDYKLPEGYTSSLVGDTLVIKDKDGNALSADQIDALASDNIIAQADKNGDKKLSYKELGDSIKEQLQNDLGIMASPEMKVKIDQAIQKIDADGNGEITKEELNKNYNSAMAELQEEIIQATDSDPNEPMSIDNIITAADVIEEDGKISKEEFNEYLESAKENGIKETRTFEQLDKNGDGFISKDDL